MHPGDVEVGAGLINQAAQVQARADGADGSGEHVVEHEGRDGELGQGAAHGLVHHFVHAAAHEHGAALDVDGAHGVGEQHDRQDEPGRGFPDGVFGDAADVIRRRGQVAEHDGRRFPEGNERQHDGGGHNHLDRRRPLFRCHVKVS